MSDIAHRQDTEGSQPAFTPPKPERLTRATVNLTPKSVRAIKQAADLTGDTRTDIINRSVQIYGEIQQVLSNGGELYVRPEKDADLQQLRIW
ncbi:hypothetical protein [Streptomyces sp. NPDC053069]|uniref:hypothetical protein n=1 Tax=Streptomyces sp. NPDC053069 TaxID=3365695 RepID=UPI0037CD85F1